MVWRLQARPEQNPDQSTRPTAQALSAWLIQPMDTGLKARLIQPEEATVSLVGVCPSNFIFFRSWWPLRSSSPLRHPHHTDDNGNCSTPSTFILPHILCLPRHAHAASERDKDDKSNSLRFSLDYKILNHTGNEESDKSTFWFILPNISLHSNTMRFRLQHPMDSRWPRNTRD